MSVEGSVKRQTGRFDLLDIARFLCAGWVLVYHYIYTYAHIENAEVIPAFLLPISKYGYMGVEFFFIISGFVIAFSSRGKSPLQFFESRFFRIWPTFLICMTATALILHITGVRALGLVEYLANVTILPSYLGVKPYDGVYWTLAYEIFFYAIVFALILCRVRHFERVLLAAGPVLLILLSLFALSEASYLALFLIGMGFFNLSQGRDVLLAIISVTAMMVLATIGAYVRAEALGFDGFVGATVLVALFAIFALLTLGPLSTAKVRYARDIGLVTYPLYLLHSKIGTTLADNFGSTGAVGAKLMAVTVFMIFLSWIVSRMDLLIVQGPIRSLYRTRMNTLLPAAAQK
uniref:acyltransferase family protein n=1 Tax=Parerythrobacter lutipelagi TaxID=1964208 RepID=UPI0010F9272B|nr:acyltransferase [Parerythrobacter lutipelagi]